VIDVQHNARVQSFYREVNEGIASISEAWEIDMLELLCECGEVSCSERILVPVAIYEQLRAAPTHFVVKPGHEDPAVEAVVSTAGDYAIVANRGAAAAVARGTDPRAGSS
jgi:hypothetical protein